MTNRIATRPASPAARAYLLALRTDLAALLDAPAELVTVDDVADDARACSRAIDSTKATLAATRRDQRTAAARPAPAAAVTDGMYMLDGVVYKVQRAVHGSGNLYAKALDTEAGRFAYAAGAIRRLRAEHRMTAEQAKAFGDLYGMCCRCAATLTDEESIARGMGPVCAGKL